MTKKTSGAKRTATRQPAELLREVITECYKGVLERAKEDAKLGDWLKMIELHRKIAPQESSQKKLWDSLEKIRQEILGKKQNSKPGRTGGTKKREHKKQ